MMKKAVAMSRLRKLPRLWFVYQFGVLDFIATTRKQAEEMAEDPTGDKTPYHIERWVYRGGKYEFDRRIR